MGDDCQAGFREYLNNEVQEDYRQRGVRISDTRRPGRAGAPGDHQSESQDPGVLLSADSGIYRQYAEIEIEPPAGCEALPPQVRSRWCIR